MKKASLCLALSLAALIVFAAAASAGPVKFARTPHIAKGRIAFSYHGDIWIAQADGPGELEQVPASGHGATSGAGRSSRSARCRGR